MDPAFPGAVIGDLTAVDRNRFVLIERDAAQGVEAQQKKIYLIDLRRTDSDGYLEKRLVLDLLAIRDPRAGSRCRRGPASSASATRSRSRCNRWRASRCSTTTVS